MASRADLQLQLQLAKAVRDEIISAAPKRMFGRLRRSFRYIVTKERVVIYSTYYWVRWVNDGRRAITAKPGKVLVFYVPSSSDPRITSDYPRRPADVKQLQRGDSKVDVVFARSVKAAKGLRFIEEGIRRARRLVPNIFREKLRTDVRKLLRRGRNKLTINL